MTDYPDVLAGMAKRAPLPRAISPAWRLAVLPVAFLVLFFVIPVLMLLVVSLFEGRSFTIIPNASFDNYARILGAAGFWTAMGVGMMNGFFTATVSVLLAFPVAWYIVYRTTSGILMNLVLLSWFSSFLVRVYAWRTILGTNGVINSFLMSTGIVDQPVSWLIFSPFAAILTLVHVMFPFALLILVSALRDVKKDYLDAARDLGSNGATMLRRVVLPMAQKGIVGSYMFTFILAAGDFVTPQLLGGMKGVSAGLLVANQFRSSGNWPLGAAMAFLMMVAFLLVYLALILLMRTLGLTAGRRLPR